MILFNFSMKIKKTANISQKQSFNIKVIRQPKDIPSEEAKLTGQVIKSKSKGKDSKVKIFKPIKPTSILSKDTKAKLLDAKTINKIVNENNELVTNKYQRKTLRSSSKKVPSISKNKPKVPGLNLNEIKFEMLLKSSSSEANMNEAQNNSKKKLMLQVPLQDEIKELPLETQSIAPLKTTVTNANEAQNLDRDFGINSKSDTYEIANEVYKLKSREDSINLNNEAESVAADILESEEPALDFQNCKINSLPEEDDVNNTFDDIRVKGLIVKDQLEAIVEDNEFEKTEKFSTKGFKPDEDILGLNYRNLTPFMSENDHYHSNFKSSQFSLVFQERTTSFKRRKAAIIKGNYFTKYLINEVNFLDSLKKISRDYADIMSQQYQETQRELNTINELFTIFIKPGQTANPVNIEDSERMKQFCFNSNLSKLVDLENLCEQLEYPKPEKLKYVRNVLSNGDSFYSCFLFSLLEQQILMLQIDNFLEVVVDIYKVIQVNASQFESKQEVVNKTFEIFYEIFNLLESSKIALAHSTLISAYNSVDQSFVSTTVYYLRYITCLIAEDFQNEVIESYPMIQQQILFQENLEIEDINLLKISNIYNEACKYSFQLLPMIFDVTLQIDVYESYLDDATGKEKINFNVFNFDKFSNERQNPYKINIVYMESNYCVGYENGCFAISQLGQHNLNQIDSYDCRILKNTNFSCKCRTNEFVVIPPVKQAFCLLCSKKQMISIIGTRACMMNKESYNNLEYNVRPISLFDDLQINNILFRLIYKESIQSVISNSIRNICFFCDIKYDEKEIIILPSCGCQSCFQCLDKLVLKYTRGYYLLNKVELENFTKILCYCGEVFNYEASIKLLGKNLAEAEEEKKVRLEKYANSLCMLCLHALTKTNIEDKVEEDHTQSRYKVVNIVEQKLSIEDHNIVFTYHLVCPDCVYLNFTSRKENLSESRQSPCRICFTDHLLTNETWIRLMNKPKIKCKCIVF